MEKDNYNNTFTITKLKYEPFFIRNNFYKQVENLFPYREPSLLPISSLKKLIIYVKSNRPNSITLEDFTHKGLYLHSIYNNNQ